MLISEKLQMIRYRNEKLSNETFRTQVEKPQFVQSSGVEINQVQDLFGNKVETSPQFRELLYHVNGGANLVFGEHWLSVAEMADPFGPEAEYLRDFDQISSLERAKASFFEALEDEIYSYQEVLGAEPTGSLSESERLVLFGYNLIEIGARPTYLFFGEGMKEPMVWSSAVDWTQLYEDLDAFLDVFLK